MKYNEKEIRFRIASVGTEIVGVRDIEKRAEIIMRCTPIADSHSSDYNVRDVDEVVEGNVVRCPYCNREIENIEVRRTGIRYEYLYEDGETEEYDTYNGDDEEYFCPRCGNSLSYSDLENMGVRL
jgi:DNA-directed RNA polymerase subunit RPC12/RpoP